ncbi:MAG: carboxypeptidase regulatory-like domain-containing protein [Acidobacteriota bacterium]
MKVRAFVAIIAVFTALICFRVAPGRAATTGSVALSGLVSSTEEGPMEGVLVSAKKAGSTITITVVSDEQGRYQFPSSKLAPGQYALRIRAGGYDLASPSTIDISADKTTADLKLRPAADPASQLSNAEWFASLPGTEQQKASVRNCTHCHTLERIMRSRADANGLVKVVERMSTYPQLSFPLLPQKLVAARVGGGEDPLEQKLEGWRKQAQYLSTVNLSSTDQWKYPFKFHSRPKGKATQVIYTEYDLPQRTRQPHDVVVDSEGMAWYASFGELILGKIDTRTGKATEYQIPRLKAKLPGGELALRFDKNQNLWMGMQFQGGIAKFDKNTEKFQTWSLPPEINGDYVQINQVSADHAQVDGKVWLQDAGTYTVLRLDLKSGKFEVFTPFAIPRPNIYDVISDAQNNAYFTVMGKEHIGRIDAKTGKITLLPTPTPGSAPRRGMIDEEGHLWFGENRADRIGMLDTKTEQFKEWKVPTPGTWPYDVTGDKNGEAWAGGEFTDTVQRLNPKTGEFVEYLLPRFTNMRRVFVDNSTTPVTFWVGNNHGASIVKLEPLN